MVGQHAKRSMERCPYVVHGELWSIKTQGNEQMWHIITNIRKKTITKSTNIDYERILTYRISRGVLPSRIGKGSRLIACRGQRSNPKMKRNMPMKH